ncbi:hypothetical protein [Bacillus sp. FJAT-42315]|uniref:hypothetical protein n=1 Tax=Bacillus sp. FJAT-42315 TaxID=2014077 RepID=UPI000BA931BB|nr:hypothetical protein [Bacillus sp. FJAT-42315]PAQ14291.1 hypothetical protein CD798_11320 [Bacillaceae bacterium SAOS 7]
MQKKDVEFSFLPDTQFEGKHKAFLDVDRMINEGLSGGSVHMREDEITSNIEEAHILVDETPPRA